VLTQLAEFGEYKREEMKKKNMKKYMKNGVVN
jgi:hypothetical protein